MITQDNQPVAFYSRKLNNAQRNYTVGEKELLSVVETLKEYRTMLYGCPDITVYTDHKNNTFQNIQTQRVLRWRLFLEDYGVKFQYIKGESNSLADALSRLPFDERQNPRGPDSHSPGTASQSHSARDTSVIIPSDSGRSVPIDSGRPVLIPFGMARSGDMSPPLPERFSETSYGIDKLQSFNTSIDDDDLIDLFVHLPPAEHVPFVLDYPTIAVSQAGDAQLQLSRQATPLRFEQRLMAPNTSIWYHRLAVDKPWKIYLPQVLLNRAIRWYHLALSHLGSKRLFDTMSMIFYHRELRNRLEAVIAPCEHRQKYKNVLRGHGHTAPREAGLLPWNQVAVDLIGPWTLTISDETIQFTALTIIDMVTNIVELVRLDNKTSDHVANQFVNTWLARYPKPSSCIYDQGSEFIGWGFQAMLDRYDIQRRPTTVKNPQANAICERMHQAVGNSLRVLRQLNPPAGAQTPQALLDTALANAMYATRSSYNSAILTTPGAMAFHRDMVMNIPFLADLNLIQQHRQHLIDERLLVNNRKRYSYDYQPGQQVLKLAYKPDKLAPRATGPYLIHSVHANGTLTLQMTPYVRERVSLRNVKPFVQ